MRKTKIICTLGPSTDKEGIMESLVKEGMDVARFNFSHGSHEEQAGRLRLLEELREKYDKPIAALLDTKGPEIRIGCFENNGIDLQEGQTFTLTTADISGNEEKVSITYKELYKDVKPGDAILIDDGLIGMEVMEISGEDIVCTVKNGGHISNRKGINVPGVELNMPFVSAKDYDDILFGIKEGFDFIAASFTRTAADVLEIRRILKENGGSHINIIAKIENQQGVDHINEIIKAADGIMIARGDMGVEIPLEEVPVIQKKLISKVYTAGKQVITATQMLDSMMKHPRPTRAETTDVANAIYDGTDAIMLSGETAKGKYPVEAVKMMNQIAISTEVHLSTKIKDYRSKYINRGISAAVAYSAVQTAHNVNAKCILASSMSGFTTRIVSKFKPDAQIIGLSPDDAIVRQMQIYWGVRPFKSHKAETTKDLLDEATDIVLDAGLAEKDDILVLTGGGPANHRGKGVTNMLKVVKIGEFGE